jgi:hypothetical protein
LPYKLLTKNNAWRIFATLYCIHAFFLIIFAVLKVGNGAFEGTTLGGSDYTVLWLYGALLSLVLAGTLYQGRPYSNSWLLNRGIHGLIAGFISFGLFSYVQPIFFILAFLSWILFFVSIIYALGWLSK